MISTGKLEEIAELADKLSRFVNSGTQEDIQMLADAVLKDHRTLQQQTFGFFLMCIRKWAALEGNWYDLRNEWTVQTCKQIVEKVDDVQYCPPFI
jgi:hypothetical protein